MLGLEVPPLRSERRESRDSLVAATTTSCSPVALAWCPPQPPATRLWPQIPAKLESAISWVS